MAYEFELGGKSVKIGGIAKGSGMIHPNMATMLCFITTDVAIEATLLQQALSKAINKSFNMISVDGDTRKGLKSQNLRDHMTDLELIFDVGRSFHQRNCCEY